LNGYGGGRGGAHSTEDLAKKLGRTHDYKIEVIEGSFIHTDWVAELAMAQSMIDSALSNFSQQAKQAGGLPEAVGKAFAEGKAIIDDGQVVTVGSFVRKDVSLCIVTADYGLLMVKDGSASSTPFPPKPAYILPGSSDYEACLIEAAKLEDASSLNTYSGIALEVAQYRTTAMVREFYNSIYSLPQPYFPIVFRENEIKCELMQSLYDEQNKLIISRNGNYFKAPFDADIQAKESRPSLYPALISYAKGHNKKLAWNLDDHSFRLSLKINLADSFKTDEENELRLLLADKTASDETGEETSKAFIDFVQSKVNFIDFSGAMADDIHALMPFSFGYVYVIAKRNLERASEQAAGEKEQPELPVTTTEEEAAVKFGESEGNPDDIVAIVGETKKWMVAIKSMATDFGGRKYKWDKRAGAWNVRRSTWEALIERYSAANRELKIIPATIARF
jgi:hypothetical protein